MNKNEFTVTIDTKEVVLKTVPINQEIRLESNRFYAKALDESLSNSYLIRPEVDKILESKGLLKNNNDIESSDLRKAIKDLEIQLRKGFKDHRRMTKDEAKQVALSIRKARTKLTNVGSEVNAMYNNTAENYAENERIQYFIYACTVYADSGNRFWKSFASFKDETDAKLVEAISRNFISVVYGIDKDHEKNLYENKWLIKMGYLNEDFQFMRKDGKLVDENDHLIDKDGRFVDEQGDYVDIFGNRVDKDGNLLEVDSWGVI
jgi:hypothetical protein